MWKGKEVKFQQNALLAPWGSRSVEVYEKIEQIGEGTFGKVYMAKDKETGEIVALKKIRMQNEKEGFPVTAMREIKLLKELKHPNIVRLKEIVTSSTSKDKKNNNGVYMVFDYMDHDLTGLMINEPNYWRPTAVIVKCIMKQLLEGLSFCHAKGVLHRDIKGSNLLVNNKGIIKLADFGLARTYSMIDNNSQYTNRVITLWYRPPELLLGASQYGPSVDMWSVGCIFAELLGNKAIFPGKNEVDQLDCIFKLCGSPTEDSWPGYSTLPWYTLMSKTLRYYPRTLNDHFNSVHPLALDLLEKFLTLNPAKRISANDALKHKYFHSDPLPCDPKNHTAFLAECPSSHEFQAKKRRNERQSADNTKKTRYSSDVNKQTINLCS